MVSSTALDRLLCNEISTGTRSETRHSAPPAGTHARNRDEVVKHFRVNVLEVASRMCSRRFAIVVLGTLPSSAAAAGYGPKFILRNMQARVATTWLYTAPRVYGSSTVPETTGRPVWRSTSTMRSLVPSLSASISHRWRVSIRPA